MLKEKVAEIQGKAAEVRSTEDIEILERHEARRLKKNNRSKQRLAQRKEELNRILNIPRFARTVSENKFLEVQVHRKNRKNDGDKLRRLRKKHGDHDELKLPPIVRGASIIVATTPQLQMERIGIPNYELSVPPGYGEDEGILPNHNGGLVQETVGENTESLVDSKKVGEGQLSQTATEESLPEVSSLVLQQTAANRTPLSTAPSSLLPPSATSSVPHLPLILPPNPFSYRQQYNSISPLPAPLGTSVVPYHPSSLIAPPPDGAAGLHGGGMVNTAYHSPSPRFQDYFHHNRPPWVVPPPSSSHLSTFSTTFGGDGGGDPVQHFMHQHLSLADQAGVAVNTAMRQRQAQQNAMLASAFVVPKPKAKQDHQQQQLISPSQDPAIAVETTTTEDDHFFLVNPAAAKTDKALLKKIVEMTAPQFSRNG
jgi:hypothetical protein